MITLAANSQIYKGFCVSLCLTADARCELTDWTNYASVAGVIGIATNDGGAGQPIIIQDHGIYENTQWTFTRGLPVFAFASGLVTQNIPPKNIIQVGRAISPTQILIRISDFIMVSQ